MNKIPITILTFSFLAVIWISWITFNPDQAKSGLVRFVTISELEDVNEDEEREAEDANEHGEEEEDISLGGRIVQKCKISIDGHHCCCGWWW